jgi:hypothetical protein
MTRSFVLLLRCFATIIVAISEKSLIFITLLLIFRRCFLFFYLNDLHDYFENSNSIECVTFNEELLGIVKLLSILYADDTVVLSESANYLQIAMSLYKNYCDNLKVKVNTSKTKGRRTQYSFTYGNENLRSCLGIQIPRSIRSHLSHYKGHYKSR